METNEVRDTREVRETTIANRRPVWPYIVGAALLLLLLLLVGRSCWQDYGDVPPVMSDTLETDTMMAPPVNEGYGPADTTDMTDTGMNEPNMMTPSISPQGPGATPSTPGMGTP